MATKHSPQFLAIVEKAKSKIREVSVADVKKKIDAHAKNYVLIDCREDHEWNEGHLPEAVHIGKGIIERDIEARCPDINQEIIIYCGGGFRSALAAASLAEMGYRNLWSMAGGYRAWKEAAYPLEGKKT